MKSGDMIEWVSKFSGELVHKRERLWSTVEGRYVPIGSEMVHLLVSIDDETFSWLNEKGLFHARVDDTTRPARSGPGRWVVPRTRAK